MNWASFENELKDTRDRPDKYGRIWRLPDDNIAIFVSKESIEPIVCHEISRNNPGELKRI
jgi:hypothetical protein